jgi:AcrR family transcriptional regulator
MEEAPLVPAPQDGRRRADAARNRDRLIEVATALFERGESATLDAVARAAGVGIGTLYRHFPTREALVESVYRSELEALCARAETLAGAPQADVALRTWMDGYSAFVRTKRRMGDDLQAALVAGAGSDTRERINGAVGVLLAAGVEQGVLRNDVPADDVTSAMLGALLATRDPSRADQSGRLLDLLVTALRRA